MTRITSSEWQLTFPVMDDTHSVCGPINAEVLRTMTAEQGVAALTVAADLMETPLLVKSRRRPSFGHRTHVTTPRP
jgi:hypothetical protein